MLRQTLMLSLMAAFFLSLVGCGGGSSPEASIANANETNMDRLVNLYVRFQTQHQWKGPRNEEEFKSYINELAPNVLERMGVEAGSTDELFVSSADSEPFKIRYGVRGSARGSNEAIIFDAEGSGGMRRVGFTSSTVEEVDSDGRYNGLLSGKVREPLSAPGRELRQKTSSLQGDTVIHFLQLNCLPAY